MSNTSKMPPKQPPAGKKRAAKELPAAAAVAKKSKTKKQKRVEITKEIASEHARDLLNQVLLEHGRYWDQDADEWYDGEVEDQTRWGTKDILDVPWNKLNDVPTRWSYKSFRVLMEYFNLTIDDFDEYDE